MIKCFEPSITQADEKRVLKTLRSKILAYGKNVKKFEDKYRAYSKKKYNIGFNSASSAAYLLYQHLYEKFGSCRVYTTSLGFVSPVFAAIKNGHEVVYVDVDDNLLLCVESLNTRFIKDEKKSIVMPVLYGGVSTIDKLESFCENNSSILVLDSAHCISPTMNYDYAFYSFHPVKPVCMSNGGLLATSNEQSAAYMFSGRNFGRKNIGDTYDLVQSGFNFYMNNLNAALGLSQLERCDKNVAIRKQNYNFLKSNIPSELGRFTNHDESSSYYLSSFVLNDGYFSDKMREDLLASGIQTSFHYPFLHTSSFYKDESSLPKLEGFSNRIINLPIHQELSNKDKEKIIDECIRYSRSRSKPQ